MKKFTNTEQRGFTLLEVLVAVVVLSIGLLGLAGLQATAMSNNNSAFMRSQAAFLAYDLADRVRANADTSYVTAMGSAGDQGGSCESNAGGCTPAQMAAYDIWLWQTQLATSLPMGVGVICRDSGDIRDGTGPGSDGCSGSGDLTIKIWWDNDRSGVADNIFSMSFRG